MNEEFIDIPSEYENTFLQLLIEQKNKNTFNEEEDYQQKFLPLSPSPSLINLSQEDNKNSFIDQNIKTKQEEDLINLKKKRRTHAKRACVHCRRAHSACRLVFLNILKKKKLIKG